MDRHPTFWEWVVFAIVFFILFFMIQGCAPLIPVPDVNELRLDTIKHRLQVNINGHIILGAGVAEQALFYNVEIKADKRVDRIHYMTCNRDWEIDRPEAGWSQGTPGFTYLPIAGLEDSIACGLDITAIGEKDSYVGLAFIDFLDKRPEFTLRSVVVCNGSIVSFDRGVSVCQNAPGLVNEIRFEVPVIVRTATQRCDVFDHAPQKVFRFIQPEGVCTYTFVAQARASNGERFSHRLNTIGYTKDPTQ